MSTPRMQCRHVFTDGHRCLGHCLRQEDFCYFHHTARRPVQNPSARRRRGTTFTLPELEDRAAIQLALFEILQRIASNDIDPKRAGHLLFGLQIATSLLPKQDPKHQPKFVAEITHDPELGDLAPAAQVGHDDEPSALDRIVADFQRRKAEREQAEREATTAPVEVEQEEEVDEEAEQAENPEEETLPTIQASADSNLIPQISQLIAIPPSTKAARTALSFPLLLTPYSLLPASPRPRLVSSPQPCPPPPQRRRSATSSAWQSRTRSSR